MAVLRWALARAPWVLVGAVALYALTPPPPPDLGPDLIVPASRIREVPGEVRWRDRIVYRYVTAEPRVHAPGGADLRVASFCRPVVALALQDTAGAAQAPRQETVTSLALGSSLWPLRRDPLVVTSMANDGDLVQRHYRVRDAFEVGTGDSVVVRYGRASVGRELLAGAAWWAAFEGARLVVGSAIRSAQGR